jgi:hypothetical protein
LNQVDLIEVSDELERASNDRHRLNETFVTNHRQVSRSPSAFNRTTSHGTFDQSSPGLGDDSDEFQFFMSSVTLGGPEPSDPLNPEQEIKKSLDKIKGAKNAYDVLTKSFEDQASDVVGHQSMQARKDVLEHSMRVLRKAVGDSKRILNFAQRHPEYFSPEQLVLIRDVLNLLNQPV